MTSATCPGIMVVGRVNPIVPFLVPGRAANTYTFAPASGYTCRVYIDLLPKGMKKKYEDARHHHGSHTSCDKKLPTRYQEKVNLILLEMEIAQKNWREYKDPTMAQYIGKV
jgi:hypothetical protein